MINSEKDEDSDIESNMESLWNSLAKFPYECVVQYMQVSNKLVGVPEKKIWFFLGDENDEKPTGDGIYVYGSDDSWGKYWEYPSNLTLSFHSATYDRKNAAIFILTTKHLLRQHGHKIEVLMDESSFADLFFGHMAVVNGTLHLIDGDTHYMFDSKTKKMNKIHQFQNLRHPNDFIGLHGNGLVYVKNKNCFMLFQRYRNKDIIINKYNLNTKRWTAAKMITNSNAIDDITFYGVCMDLTNDNMKASVVATVNGDYLIFMNSENETIYAFNTDSGIIRKCNIEFVYQEYDYECYLTIIRDTHVDKMSAFGYIRDVTKAMDVEVPVSVQTMASNYVCNEMLHVVQWMTGDHWAISVDAVIQSLENE